MSVVTFNFTDVLFPEFVEFVLLPFAVILPDVVELVPLVALVELVEFLLSEVVLLEFRAFV